MRGCPLRKLYITIYYVPSKAGTIAIKFDGRSTEDHPEILMAFCHLGYRPTMDLNNRVFEELARTSKIGTDSRINTIVSSLTLGNGQFIAVDSGQNPDSNVGFDSTYVPSRRPMHKQLVAPCPGTLNDPEDEAPTKFVGSHGGIDAAKGPSEAIWEREEAHGLFGAFAQRDGQRPLRFSYPNEGGRRRKTYVCVWYEDAFVTSSSETSSLIPLRRI
ncbi:hypothetical protein C8R42DRAFT_780576 [Lentinula raphanica]|nr:hypothetical protein C8R42DRAFT_780576 [Lentinula raphanica]